MGGFAPNAYRSCLPRCSRRHSEQSPVGIDIRSAAAASGCYAYTGCRRADRTTTSRRLDGWSRATSIRRYRLGRDTRADFIRTPLIVTVIRRIAFAPVLLCTACAFDSCATSNTTFEEIFTKVRAVELEERDPDPLIGIRDLDILPDGRLLVVDRHAGRLRIFSADGAIDTVIGRFGDGPGEFRQPNAAAVGLDGRILVTQATPRVTLLTPDGSVERIGTLPGWLAGDMEPLGSGFVGYISKYGWEGAILDL